MELPEILKWLEAAKIGAVAFLLVAITQYVKPIIPENKTKFIRLFSVLAGIILAYLCDLYMETKIINHYKVILNGILGAVFAELGYQFLSGKGGPFSLPSRDQLEKPK
jgi:hypothetical protein